MEAVHPNHIYRLHEGPRLFGFKRAQIDTLIKQGEIPTPITLTPGGRAKGWLGKQILDWQAARLATVERRGAA